MTPRSEGLIVDVGMHDGSDTEFYLSKGFDVLAVEANPALVHDARARFTDELADGRLEIAHVAVADHDGEIEFYVSNEDLWGSTTPAMANRGIESSREAMTVPCTTLDSLLAERPVAHYVKIDVEGADPHCVDAIGRMPRRPRFLSFEADLTDRAETHSLLDKLEEMGYQRFKLVNQAVHSKRRLPNPPLEGRFVDTRFTKHHSGPFGEESPGDWVTITEVKTRYEAVLRQQAARIEYSASGTIFGISVRWLHRPLFWFYNVRPVAAARQRWAEWRGVEPGGWFDIHAGR